MSTQNMSRAIIWSVKTSMPAQYRQVPAAFQSEVRQGGSPVLNKNQVEILPDEFFSPFNKIRGAFDREKREKHIPLRMGALVNPRKSESAQRFGQELSVKWNALVVDLTDRIEAASQIRRDELVSWGQQQDWSEEKLRKWESFVNKVVPSRGEFIRRWTCDSTLTIVTSASSDDPRFDEASRRGLADIFDSGVESVLEATAKWANERLEYARKATGKKPMNAASVKVIKTHLDYLRDSAWLHPTVGVLAERLDDSIRPILSSTKIYGLKAKELAEALEPLTDFWDLIGRWEDDMPLYPLNDQERLLPNDPSCKPQPTPPDVRDYFVGRCMDMVTDSDDSSSGSGSETSTPDDSASDASYEATDSIESSESDSQDSDSATSDNSDQSDLFGLDPSLMGLFGSNDSKGGA